MNHLIFTIFILLNLCTLSALAQTSAKPKILDKTINVILDSPKKFSSRLEVESWLLASLQKDIGVGGVLRVWPYATHKFNFYFRPSLEILNDYANNKTISPELSSGFNWHFILLGLATKYFQGYRRPHIGLETGLHISFKNSPWGIVSYVSFYKPTQGKGVDFPGLPHYT